MRRLELSEILGAVDHTLLAPTAAWEQIRQLCDDALFYHTASVCIAPCFVKQAAEYLGGRLAVCTVIGFPNGNASTACKCFEAEDAIRSGADELDAVVNLGMVKAR